VEFGLGSATTVDTLIVSWPSGEIDRRSLVAVDQVLTIHEGVEVDIPRLDNMPIAFRLYGNRPNPFNPTTNIRFDLPDPARVELKIYDVCGRLVMALIDGEKRQAGRNEILWQGTDGSGRSVGSGIYFIHLKAGSFTAARKIVLVK
jgi:hypothetical protein